MASKHRERKAIDAVACPACGAPKGELCRRPALDGPALCPSCRGSSYEGWQDCATCGGTGFAEQRYVPRTVNGRPMICAERRTAWQMARDARKTNRKRGRPSIGVRRVNITLDPETLAALDQLAQRMGTASRSATLRRIILDLNRTAPA